MSTGNPSSQPPSRQPNSIPGVRWIDFDPRVNNIRPIHPVGTAHWDPAFVTIANTFVPFNQTLSDAVQPIQLVEAGGEYFVFSGHHRMYALRNLHTLPQQVAPATIRVQVFTCQEYAAFPNADPVFRGNLSLIQVVIQVARTANATFPLT